MSQIPLPVIFSEAMAAKDLSNLETARLLGFNNPSAVSMIRSGRMQLPEDKLLATVRHLGIPAATLLEAWSRARKNSDVHALLVMCLEEYPTSTTPEEEQLLTAYQSAIESQSVAITHENCSSTPELVAAALLLQTHLKNAAQSVATKTKKAKR